MWCAVAGLTHLDCEVSDEDELVGSQEITAELIFRFLLTAKNLERCRLCFGRLVDGILQPLLQSEERQCSQGSMRLLHHLTHHSTWNRLRDVELEIVTDRTTLVQFLVAHKDTLRSLTLTRMTLVRLEDPLNNWEVTLDEITRELSLESLALSKLCDFPEDWSRGVQNRMLFDFEAELWRGKARPRGNMTRTTTQHLDAYSVMKTDTLCVLKPSKNQVADNYISWDKPS
jgi:hypothetical protein